jgi:hypothetical protein
MKKVRLTESQLITLIKKIVKEQSVVNGPSECLEEHINMRDEMDSEYMNYLKDQDLPLSLKRRLVSFDSQVEDIINNSDASVYSDEFEYADNMISDIVDNFNIYDIPGHEDDDELYDRVYDYIKIKYGDRLLGAYYENGGE